MPPSPWPRITQGWPISLRRIALIGSSIGKPPITRVRLNLLFAICSRHSGAMHPPPFRLGQRLSDWPDCRLELNCCRGQSVLPVRMLIRDYGAGHSPRCWPSCGARSAGSPLPRCICALVTASSPWVLRRSGDRASAGALNGLAETRILQSKECARIDCSPAIITIQIQCSRLGRWRACSSAHRFSRASSGVDGTRRPSCSARSLKSTHASVCLRM